MRGHFSKFFSAVVVSAFGHAALATDLSNSVTGSVSDNGQTLPYRLFQPTLNTNHKSPLILFLHGMGERGTDNVEQTKWMNGIVNATKSGDHAAYVLAPQIDTNSWFQSYSNTPTQAMTMTIAALKKVINTENVDTSRVYVTGLSMGGMGTWDILGREPGLFAAAVPMSGGGDERTADKIKNIPIWAFHGDADNVVPVNESRSMVNAVNAAGGNAKLTEVEGGGHAIWDSIYTDAGNTLYPWLFAQHLTEDTTSVVDAPLPSVFTPSLDLALSGSSVPEPTSIGGIALAGAFFLNRRSRRA